MRRTAIVLVVILSVTANGAATSDPPWRDTAGRMVSLDDYRGKVVLLNFWATWCPPCRAETPDLVALQAKYADAGLQIIGVTVPPFTRSKVRSYTRAARINFPVVYGTKTLLSRFSDSPTLPLTVVIDREGRER